MTVVIGFDPGQWLGWCAVVVEGKAARYLAAGVLSVDELGEGALARALHFADGAHAELVAIEEPQGIAPGIVRALTAKGAGGTIASMSANLVAAGWRGGELAAASRAAGRRVVRAPATTVRAYFLAGVSGAERSARKAAGEKLDLDGALWAAAEWRIALWPPHLRGEGAAYKKNGTDLLADKKAHAADAALLAVYAGLELAPEVVAAAPPARQLRIVGT